MTADLVCQMCGKVNPADREICLQCGARLVVQPPDETVHDQIPAGEPGSQEGVFPKPGITAGGEGNGIPDWLASLGDAPGLPVDNESPIPRSDDLELASNEKAVPQPESPVTAGEDVNPSPEVQDGKEESSGLSPISGEEPLIPEGTGNRSQEKPDAELPDWLFEPPSDAQPVGDANQGPLGSIPPEEKVAGLESAAQAGAIGSGDEYPETPKWLDGIRSSPEPGPAGEPAVNAEAEPAGSGLNEPDWLSGIKPEEGSADATGEGKPAASGEKLAEAELPSWIQALRPVESVMPGEAAGLYEEGLAMENQGPLAGIKGVLPLGPGLGGTKKPPAYSNLLQVSESQQKRVALLGQMISRETQASQEKPSRIKVSRLWRWVITVVMILAVWIPFTPGFPATPASSLEPPELVRAFTVVSSLSAVPGAPVLMVVDYEPAFSAEMEAAAAAIVDHLLLQGPRLAILSTNPTGPALAERLLHGGTNAPLAARQNYLAGQQYVNLGYLAGGQSGVQLFALSPAEASPATMEGEPAWDLPPLQGIQRLSDFSALLILTDNADSGRVWVEQTQAVIGATPLLMIISAQAEPMILPYYDSGQVDGLVTGLAGGAAYEQILAASTSQAGVASQYWNALAMGTLAAVILITAGAGISLVGWKRNRQPNSRKGVR